MASNCCYLTCFVFSDPQVACCGVFLFFFARSSTNHVGTSDATWTIGKTHAVRRTGAEDTRVTPLQRSAKGVSSGSTDISSKKKNIYIYTSLQNSSDKKMWHFSSVVAQGADAHVSGESQFDGT